MIDETRFLQVMRNTIDLPREGFRTVYEAGDSQGRGNGKFYIDFASYGGTTEQVPRCLIDNLEESGVLVRAFAPHINAWRLSGTR